MIGKHYIKANSTAEGLLKFQDRRKVPRGNTPKAGSPAHWTGWQVMASR